MNSIDAKVRNINRIEFKKNLRVPLQNKLSSFKEKMYKQIDGVSTGSLLGPTLTNVFLCFQKQIWLNEYPDEFKPVYYRRYVDDIFVWFRSPDHFEKFNNYLNCKHRNIRFTYEKNMIIPCLF